MKKKMDEKWKGSVGERKKRQISVRFRKEDCNVGRRNTEGRM